VSKLFRLLCLTGALIAMVVVGFSLYSHFLVDYSLESLEFALSATDKKPDSSSRVGTNVYRNLLKDLALEEVSEDSSEVKNLAMLELAARSFDETSDRAGNQRAKLYLQQTADSKSPERQQVLRLLDDGYRYLRNMFYQILKFFHYVRQQMSSETEAPLDVSSYLLLSQAEEKEKKWQLTEAADLYRKFLEFYPEHPDHSFVTISLAHILMKQKKYHEAERLLRGLVVGSSGVEEYQIATALLKKIDGYKKREDQIKELENLLLSRPEGKEADALRLKLALDYLYSYSIDRAQELLRELQQAQDHSIRVKAKFYLGWIYKLQTQYDQGAKVLLELSEEKGLEKDMGLGVEAQLADIYYQQNDSERSLVHYQKISEGIKSSPDATSQKASQEAWSALADSEQAVIYYFDLGDREKAQESLNRLSGSLPEYAELTDLKSALQEAAAMDLRDLAFSQLKKGRVYESLDLFKKKMKQEPNDGWTHSGLASVYVLLTDLYLAEVEAVQGYTVKPDQYTTSVLGYVRAYKSQFDESIELYKRALEMDSEYIPAKFNLAGVYLTQKKYEEGLVLLEELEVTFKDYRNIMKSKVLNNKGYALWWTGEKAAAEKCFKEALQTTPDFKDAQINLNYVKTGQGPQQIALGD